jgi:hypothetical protein
MATVQVSYTFAGGENVTVTVQAKSNYPDAIDEARGQAVKAWREAYAELTAAEAVELDE